MNRRVAALFAVVAVASACSGSTAPTWFDAAEIVSPAVAGTTVVDTGALRIVEANNQAGLPCVQVTFMDVTLSCTHNGMGDGASGYSAAARRVQDTRFIDLRTGSGVTEFVVWSDHSPSGRTIEAISAANNSILIWIMEPGEMPWGVQTLDRDGRLGEAVSFVGLPGA